MCDIKWKSQILVMLVALIFFAHMAAASDAIVAYRSNTGTTPNAIYYPKIRFWNSSGSGSWGPEIELPSAGAGVLYAIPEYSPVSDKIVIVTQDEDGTLDGYVCTSDCQNASSWTHTSNIATVDSTSASDRRFDIEFESSSGDLVLVYEVYSALTDQDLGYIILPAANTSFAGLTASYIDDPENNGLFDPPIVNKWISLDSDPASDEMVVAAFASNYNDIQAWVWDGSSWGNMKEVSTSATQTQSDEALAVAYAADGSKAMVAGADGTTGDVNWAYWNGATWYENGSFDVDTGDTRDVRWAEMETDPSTDDLQLVLEDNGRDLHTAYWDGSSWNVTSNVETSLDTFSTRVADFAWFPSGSSGLLVWEEDDNGNSLSYMICSPQCDGAINTTSGYSGSGDFLTLLGNPDDDATKVLAIRLHWAPDNYDVGSFAYNGSFINYGDSVITSQGKASFEIGTAAIQSSSGGEGDPSNCPAPITTGGSYTQAEDYAGAPNNISDIQSGAFACVVISADNVVYDCGGYSITGDGTDAAASYWTAVAINASKNVTLRNCPGLSNYSAGLTIYKTNDSTITNISSHDNPGTGISSYLSNNNTFTNNTVYNNNGTGINFASSTYNTIVNNTVYNSSTGFSFDFSSDNNVMNDTASYSNVLNGLHLVGHYNSFNNIILHHNSIQGLDMGGASNNNFTNLQSYNNSQHGINIGGSSYNIFTNVISYNNSDLGLYVSSSPYNNFTNVSLYNNSGAGMACYASNNNTFTNMTVHNNGGEGVNFASSSYATLINVTSSYNSQNGFAFDGSSNNTVMNDSTANNNGINGIHLVGQHNSFNNVILHDNPQHGLNMGGSGNNNFTDLQSYNNSQHGINVEGSPNNIFIDLTSSDNGVDGLYASGSSYYQTISGCTLHSNGQYGLDFSGSYYHNVENCNISDNADAAISLNGGGNSNFTNNIIMNNSYGIPLSSGGSPDHRFVNNTFADHDNIGLRLCGGCSNWVLINDTFYGNGIGIRSTGGALNNLLENTHFYNNGYDYFMNGSSIFYNFTTVVFDNPLGNYQNFTTLSLNSSNGSSMTYYINWTSNTTPLSGPVSGYSSFREKWIEITNLSPTTLDSVVWHWSDGEEAGYNESYFELWKEAWTDMNATLDTSANTLTVAPLNYFSIYGILQSTPPEPTNCPIVTSDWTQDEDYTGAPNHVYTNYYACVVINGDDLVYDCNGYSITGNGTLGTYQYGIFVNTTASNVTIQNCPGISNYTTGVQLYNTHDITVQNIVSSDNHETGIYLYNSHGSTIADSIFGDNSNAYGIWLSESDDNLIDNNTVYGAFYAGITLVDSYGNNITNNIAYGNDAGIGLSYSNNSILSGNTIYGNPYAGISISNSEDNLLSDNTAHDSSYGIRLTNSQNTSISGGRLYNNSRDLDVTSYSSSTLSMSNVIFDNPYGVPYTNFTNLSLNDTVTSSAPYYITWTSNSSALPADVTSFRQKWVEISPSSGSPSIDSVAWHWTDAELAGYDENKLTIIKDNGSWSFPGAALNAGANTLSIAPLSGFSDFGIVELPYVPVSTCMVIDTPGEYAQAANLVGAPHSASPTHVDYACIVINAPDVSYDCNGYSIHNNGTANAGAVVLNFTRNVTVKNCPDLAYYDIGLDVFYSNESLIENVTSHYHNANAFNLIVSHYNRFINNTGHSVSGAAFYISGGHTNNYFLNNTAHSTGGDCFYLGSGASNVTAINNTAHDCGPGDGFEIGSGSDNSTLLNNTAYHADNGFNIANGAINSTIKDNVAYENDKAGFVVQGGSTNNSFMNNTAYSNGQQGFFVKEGSSYNNFTDSISYNNSGDGFLVQQVSSYNNYINTTSHDNGGHGFYLNSGAGDSNFTNTKSYNNSGHGLFVIQTQYNIFENTESYDNGGDGLHTESGGSFTSNFTNTSLHGNDFGFYAVTGTSNNNFVDTGIYDNQKGFYLASGGISYSNFTNTRIFNNSLYGINMSQSAGIVFDDAYFSNNGYDIIAGTIGPVGYEMRNAIFDNPSGSMENFTNLSMNDSGASGYAYYLNWTNRAPSPGFISFEQKWIEIKNLTENVSIQNISWHWTDAEAAGYDESKLEVWKYNGSWSGEILDPDTSANTLSTTNFNPASDYGIVIDDTAPNVSIQSPENTTYSTTVLPLNYTAEDNGIIDSCWYTVDGGSVIPLAGCNNITLDPLPEGPHNVTVYANDSAGNIGSDTVQFTIRLGGEDEDNGKDEMRVSYEFICPGDSVEFLVKKGASIPIEDAEIRVIYDEPPVYEIVDDIETDGDGKASIVLTREGTYRIVVEKNNYVTVHKAFDFEFCPECTENTDCTGNEECNAQGECVPIECVCGELEDHQCTPYQCCSDADCPEGQVCEDNECVSPYECTADPDCDDAEYCDIPAGAAGGSCEPVAGQCGYPSNHQWVPYECGPGCPACPEGTACEDHQCVEKSIECPEAGPLGSEQTCSATSGGEPCIECDITVTAPDGSTQPGRTDGDGNYNLTMDQEGKYRVDLVSHGAVVASATVSSYAVPEIFAELNLPDWCLPVALIALLLLLLLLWWRKKKKIHAEVLTEKPALGKPVTVEVMDKGKHPMGKIAYSVLLDGKPIASGLSMQKKGTFSFTPKKKGVYGIYILGRKKPEAVLDL